MAARGWRERSVDIAEEALGEPGSLVLAPPRGILEIGLGERPNDEPAGHSRLAAVVELLAKAFLDDVPVVAGVRIDVELLHALVDDLAVPKGTGIVSGVAAIRSHSDCK